MFVWEKEYYLPSAHDCVLFTPNFLRSINHVGKFKERDHHPTPPHPQPLYTPKGRYTPDPQVETPAPRVRRYGSLVENR